MPGLEALERARSDPGQIVLEGFHAVKHALRFGADISLILVADAPATLALAAELAPDLVDALASRAVSVERAGLRGAAPQAHTNVVAVAARPRQNVEDAVHNDDGRPLVLLEDPRDLGNVGAVVRVAAAADVAGVLTTGVADPWDPAALRGSAGLHFALPVARIDALLASHRPLIGLDPGGELLDPRRLPAGAVLAFGSERRGLSEELLARCDTRVALPMRPGVSSLNLATSVSAVLFARRFARQPDRALGRTELSPAGFGRADRGSGPIPRRRSPSPATARRRARWRR